MAFKRAAASMLGISPRMLSYKLRQHGLYELIAIGLSASFDESQAWSDLHRFLATWVPLAVRCCRPKGRKPHRYGGGSGPRQGAGLRGCRARGGTPAPARTTGPRVEGAGKTPMNLTVHGTVYHVEEEADLIRLPIALATLDALARRQAA